MREFLKIFLNGSVYDEFEDFQSKWKIMNEKHMVTNHFQELEFHVIELKKFRKLDIMKPSKKEFWLWFIDHTNEELIKMSCVSNEEIMKAREQLEKIRANKELMERIRLQELAEWDYNSGIANAERKGKFENQKEIAKKMLEKGMDIDTISELTGLSLEEIEKIHKNLMT